LTKIAKSRHPAEPEVLSMATMNVSLPDPMKEWVEDQVKTGHYSNVSDYVRDLIRRDQDYQRKRAELIQALEAGEKSGVSDRTLREIWRDLKERHGRDV
jgi:antitoxin ParD1/3/4